MNFMVTPLVGIGPPEIVLILLVLVLLFGAKKLPELARGSGRALRIFKAETKGLMDDDDDAPADGGRTEDKPMLDSDRRADLHRSDVPVEQPRDEDR